MKTNARSAVSRHVWPAVFFCVSGFVVFCSGPLQARDAPRPQLDDAYGETLFSYYQRQYFGAISRLMVARERGELHQQANDGELLLGGLYVQYGMPGSAYSVFSQMMAGKDTSPQALRIWLALAELEYRRERFDDALAIISNRFSRDPSSDNRAPDAAVMLAVKSLMRLGRYAEAAEWLRDDLSSQPEGRYLRFNIAMALVANGDNDGGAKMLQPLLAMKADDEEMLALRDRVALAMASIRLRQERARDAVSVLAHARLDSPYSAEALLIYGIASLRAGELRKATASLGTLTKWSPHGQAVQEGWIALAQTYEAGNDPRRALTVYRGALTRFQGELDFLKEQQQSLARGDWFKALDTLAGDIALRDDKAGLTDRDVLGIPLHYHQLASNRFVLSYAQYVEVASLARVASDWEERIPVLEYLVQNRQERHERLTRDAAALLAETPVEPYELQQKALATRVDMTVGSGLPLTYASAKRAKTAKSADIVAADMARWPQRDWSAQREKLQLLRGVLEWEATRDAPAQAWNLRSTLRGNAQLVTQTAELRERIRHAAGVQQQSVDGWIPALNVDAGELYRLAQESTVLRERLRKDMENQALETIDENRERIVQLAAEAYFSIAQIEHGDWRARHASDKETAAPASQD